MRWIIRFVVFSLALGLGTSLWHVLSRTGTTLVQLVQKAKAPSIIQTSLPVFSAEIQQDARKDAQSFSFVVSYPEPVLGYVNTKTVVLRESADASASVVKRLKMNDYSDAEVLDATRDFLHVRFAPSVSGSADQENREQTYEGWTTWEAVVPDMSAIVLDTQTGRVVARLPLNQKFWTVARYSSDGSRALFRSSDSIYEVRTSGYTLSRSLKLSGDGELEAVFYGATDDQLYAAIRAGNPDEKLTLVRIKDDGSTDKLMEIAETGAGFAISPDARTGFIIHQLESPGYQVKISAVDLQTFSVRNSFTLQGDGYHSLHSHDVVTNHDGSELYVRLSHTEDAISVIDTRTGRRERELNGELSAHSWVNFGRVSLVGDSVLISYCDAGDDETKGCERILWVNRNGATPVEQNIAYAVEAGGERFALNSDGTHLFKLDSKNRVQERFTIERPERRKGADNGNSLSVFGLSASPDGKRIIMFIGMEHGC